MAQNKLHFVFRSSLLYSIVYTKKHRIVYQILLWNFHKNISNSMVFIQVLFVTGQ